MFVTCLIELTAHKHSKSPLFKHKNITIMFNSIKYFAYSILLMATFFCLLFSSAFANSVTVEEEESLGPQVQHISIDDAKKLYDSGATFVDTRTSLEMYFGVIKNSIAINKHAVAKKASSLIPNKDDVIVTYCVIGVRANVAAENFIKQGYQNVYVIHNAGYSGWKKAGYPIAK